MYTILDEMIAKEKIVRSEKKKFDADYSKHEQIILHKLKEAGVLDMDIDFAPYKVAVHADDGKNRLEIYKYEDPASDEGHETPEGVPVTDREEIYEIMKALCKEVPPEEAVPDEPMPDNVTRLRT